MKHSLSHIPYSSKVFLGLVVITLLLTYIAISLSDDLTNFYSEPWVFNVDKSTSQALPPAQPLIDTSDWEIYQDPAYLLSFRYPPGWTISSTLNKFQFYEVTVLPKDANSAIHIYLNNDSYYGLEGMSQTPYLVGTNMGFSVADNLVGVKAGEYYFTFDGTLNLKQADEFAGLLSTVRFE